MKRALVLLVLLGGPASQTATAADATTALWSAGRHRGICYAHALRPDQGYGSEASGQSLAAVRDLGANWVSITPFGFQRRSQDPTFRWLSGPTSGRGETDQRLLEATRQAHGLGLKVMLKPHLWLRPPDWPGSIEPANPADWQQWFATYREFIVHYAALAKQGGMDALCVGNELEKTTAHEAEWREIVRAVRAAYDGPLTYGAHMEEVFRVPFWDALDAIGVSAYYPLVEARAPDRKALVAAWKPHLARLGALSARWGGKKVLFTELGYRSADFGAGKQWEVTDQAPVNLRLQEDAYAAFFEAAWSQRWLGGVYWWKWFSYLNHSGPASNDYELEGKPAQLLVARYYRGGDRR
jgi:glycosyl hydrolase family 113